MATKVAFEIMVARAIRTCSWNRFSVECVAILVYMCTCVRVCVFRKVVSFFMLRHCETLRQPGQRVLAPLSLTQRRGLHLQ